MQPIQKAGQFASWGFLYCLGTEGDGLYPMPLKSQEDSGEKQDNTVASIGQNEGYAISW